MYCTISSKRRNQLTIYQQKLLKNEFCNQFFVLQTMSTEIVIYLSVTDHVTFFAIEFCIQRREKFVASAVYVLTY